MPLQKEKQYQLKTWGCFQSKILTDKGLVYSEEKLFDGMDNFKCFFDLSRMDNSQLISFRFKVSIVDFKPDRSKQTQ